MTLPSPRVQSRHARSKVAEPAAPRPSGIVAAPTRARHTVTVFAVTLAVITYIDRVCISQAAPAMRNDLGLTGIQMGWAFTAFTWTRSSKSPAAGSAIASVPAASSCGRHLVVVLHRGDRLGLEPRVAAGHAHALRHR